jgi:hypothetical protein
MVDCPPPNTQRQERGLPGVSEGASPADTSTPSRTVGELVSVVLSHQLIEIWDSSPRKVIYSVIRFRMYFAKKMFALKL